MFSYEFMNLETNNFDFVITMHGKVEEIDTNDIYNEVFDRLHNAGYYDVTIAVYTENDYIEMPFHVKGEFKKSIINEINEVVEYFNILNDKILGLHDDATATEDTKNQEINVENLSIADYKAMMDAWARDMRDKFVKEANLSKDEIGEQIDSATKSFVSNMGILAQKVLYITGCKLYANEIYMFCKECREENGTEGIFKCARKLRAYFADISEKYKIRGQQKDIKKAMQLKALFGDDQEQGVFGSIVSGFYWLYYKVKNYFKNVIQIHVDDNSIIGKIIEGVGLIANLIATGVKIIFTIVGHVISFVATVVTKVAVALYDAVKGILQKIKDAVEAFKNNN
jgi:hypothetical protein